MKRGFAVTHRGEDPWGRDSTAARTDAVRAQGVDGEPGIVLCSSGAVAESIASRVMRFTDGARCREGLAASGSMRVIVDQDVRDVAPVNLVAALRKDCAERFIYLVASDLSPSLLNRAYAAGADEIITPAQARLMLTGAASSLGMALPDLDGSLEAGSTGHPVGEGAERRMSCGGDVGDSTHARDVAQADNPPSQRADALRGKGTDLPHSARADASRGATEDAERASGEGTRRVEAVARQGLVLSLLSGSGGTGKSALSLLMALLLQRIGFKTVLIDLDLQFGDLRFIADGEPLVTKGEMPFTEANAPTLERYLEDSGLCFISPPAEPELAEELIGHVPDVIGLAARSADAVIVNTGSFWSDLHAIVLEQSDLVCFVMDQRATSINSCKRCTELCMKLDVPFAKFVYILNRCSYHASFSTFDCSMMLGGQTVYGIDSGGSLVDEMLDVGSPRELIDSKNMMVCSLAEMIDRMLGDFGTGGAYREKLKPFLRRKYIASAKKRRKEAGDDAF